MHILGLLLLALGDGILQHAKLFGSFLVGMLGSAAYFTALYFKFIGISDEQRGILLEPFKEPPSYARLFNSKPFSSKKVLWYSIIGGFIAVVFQYDVPNFVAVQSLILGATWPAVVSQFLSGRMVAPSQEELKEKTPKPYGQDVEKRIKKIEQGLKKKK